MNYLSFSKEKTISTTYLDDFLEILSNNFNEVYLSKKVSICKNNNIYYRNVISTIKNIKEIDYDCNQDLEHCFLVLKNGTKMTILKSELEFNDTIIMPIKTLKENDSLIIVDSIENYKGPLPNIIKTTTEEKINISLDSLNTLETKEKLSALLGYKPNNIVDLRDKEYTVKIYEKNEVITKIRYKFINEKEDMKYLDNSFYDKIKIRIADNKTLKYNGLVFVKTDNNNCLIISESKKMN
jgi:hypothetical protein